MSVRGKGRRSTSTRRESAAAGRRCGCSHCLRATSSILGGHGQWRHPRSLQFSTVPLLASSDSRRAAHTPGVAGKLSCTSLGRVQMLFLPVKENKRGKQKGRQNQENKSWVTLFAVSQTELWVDCLRSRLSRNKVFSAALYEKSGRSCPGKRKAGCSAVGAAEVLLAQKTSSSFLETTKGPAGFVYLCPDPTVAALACPRSLVPLHHIGGRLFFGTWSKLSSPGACPGHVSRAADSWPLFLERARGRAAAQAAHTFTLYLFLFCFAQFTRQEQGTAGVSWKRCRVRAGHSRMQLPSGNFRYKSPSEAIFFPRNSSQMVKPWNITFACVQCLLSKSFLMPFPLMQQTACLIIESNYNNGFTGDKLAPHTSPLQGCTGYRTALNSVLCVRHPSTSPFTPW